MKIDHPSAHHMPQLRSLWQDAFGDPDSFLDCFYRTAYAPDRCLCILDRDQIAAVLYWIDCTLEDQKLAYIYAVVTRPDYRGQGLCRTLLKETHALLKSRGYSSAVLVPQQEGLRKMYAGMGYQDMGGLSEISCAAGEPACRLRAVGPEEFAVLRRALIPEGGILQEGAGLTFLAQQLQFYTGQDFLLSAYEDKGALFGVELLGNPAAIPGILNTLGCLRGTFRMPGSDKPFAMVFPLTKAAIIPKYLGFAFD